MIKAVVFDLDDTLYPEIDYVKSGFKHIADFLAVKLNDSVENIYSKLVELFEQNNEKVFNRLFTIYDVKYKAEDITTIVNEYRNHEPDIAFYGDVLPFLKKLKEKNIKTGIITDGYKESQRKKLNKLNAFELFDEIISTDELGREYWKPHPKSFEIIKARLNLKYSEILYIGDNPEKDFYISVIYPIKTVRIIRDGFYSNRDYLDNIIEYSRINNLMLLVEQLEGSSFKGLKLEKWSDYYDISKLSSDQITENDNLITGIQVKLLNMLVYVDNLCSYNGINYTLLGGTLLGAIRHSGFIPWDDDVDIALLREDFNLFFKAIINDVDSRYLFERKELWVWKLKGKSGINDNNTQQLDVFIIDRALNSTMLFKCQIMLLKILQGMIKNKIFYKNKKLYSNVLQFITFYFGKLFKYETKMKWYDFISQLGNKQKNHSGNRFVSNDQYRYINHVLKNESVENFIEVKFNSCSFSIMEGWEEFLTKWYGKNYMKLPPMGKRIPEHTIKLNID